MFYDNESSDFVNEENSNGYATNVIVKVCGSHVTVTEAHDKLFHYGYSRKLKGKKKLGRAVTASEEDQRENARRVGRQRQRRLIDLANCQEGVCSVFLTRTYHDNQQDLDAFHHDNDLFYKKLRRFVTTGKLFGKTVKSFTPRPDFSLNALGVLEFQDGHRNETGEGRGAIHTHELNNVPYLPQVKVIVSGGKDADSPEMYLQQDGSFSPVADRNTLWFNTDREVEEEIARRKTQGLRQEGERKKRLCVVSLLWELGFCHIKSVPLMVKTKQTANMGEYMSKYMGKEADDERLRGRKAHFKRGHLLQPEVYRDYDDVQQVLELLGEGLDANGKPKIWQVQDNEYWFDAPYIGLMCRYSFNLWGNVYDWVKELCRKKMQTALRRVEAAGLKEQAELAPAPF